MQSDVAGYEALTNWPGGRQDDKGQQGSYRFGVKEKLHGRANEHFVITKSTAQDF